MTVEMLNCDCMAYMKTLEDNAFELAIVDPPYREQNQPTKDMRKNGFRKDLDNKPKKDFFDELQRVSKNQIIWGANNFSLDFKGFIVWEKGIPFDFTMSMCEIASISEGLGTISKMFKFRVAGAEKRIHANQKPIQIYKMILNQYAKKGDRILDTHSGSGSLSIACHYLDFDLVACEIDEISHNDACERFAKETRQQKLF